MRALWPETGRLGIAVSGGPDSLALLLLAQAAWPDHVEAATVDHGLRPESAAEAAMVAGLCERLKVDHETIAVEVPPGNVQDRARKVRYAALAKWVDRRGLDALASAHHADDQAETMIMRLNRGSGLSGLAGVRAIGTLPGTVKPLLRPLLRWRKAELEAVVAACGIEPARDPSNEDDRFDRVRIRKALAQADWLDPVAISNSAALLAEAWDYLARPLEDVWREDVARTASGFSYYPGNTRFENIELVATIIARMGGEARKSDVARMVERLDAGDTASLAGVLARPVANPADDSDSELRWDFEPEPPRRTG